MDSDSQPPAEPLAYLAGVRKSYGGIKALNGVDLAVSGGELLALLGPNGAGKSTAIGLWLGLQGPDEGDVRIFGRSPQRIDARRQVGVMMQEAALQPTLRVIELLSLTASYYPSPRDLGEVATMTGISSLLDRPYRKLSGGEKRKLQFAMAICGRPRLLFLDEPTVGLDHEARTAMWTTLRGLIAEGCGVVLTTHYLEEAEALADRVAVLAKGQIVAHGSVSALRSLIKRTEITCVSAISTEVVAAWPGVDRAWSDQGRLKILTADAEPVLRRMLARDSGLCDLEVRRAGLAEAFVEITREAA